MEPGQTALAWLHTGGKDLITFHFCWIRVKTPRLLFIKLKYSLETNDFKFINYQTGNNAI